MECLKKDFFFPPHSRHQLKEGSRQGSLPLEKRREGGGELLEEKRKALQNEEVIFKIHLARQKDGEYFSSWG